MIQRPTQLLAFSISALLLSWFTCSSIGFCAPQTPFARVRAEYVRLRNVNPTGADPLYRAEWEALATRMRDLLGQSSVSDDIDYIRVLSADTHLRLYRVSKQRPYLTMATESLKPLLSDSREHNTTLIGEAALLMGDIGISAGSMRESSVEWYRRAQSAGGSIGEIALSRLQSIELKTFDRFAPSRDIEVPRIARLGAKTNPRVAPIVVIDPGHGGGDAGASGGVGHLEKEITLDIARRVAVLLEKRYGLNVLITRNKDEFIPLARRTAYANKKNAAAFVSLHVNASQAHDADGLEVYYLDNANDEASRKLAERENGVRDGAQVDDLSFMLSDLIQSGKLEDSIALSRTVENTVRARAISGAKSIRSLGVKRAPFFVLVGAHMPCTLIEMLFIDNPKDRAMLSKEAFRSALALGVAEGIHRFISKQ